jgi:SAM-dependent methyltransferase
MDFIEESDIHITILNIQPQEVKFNNFSSLVGNATDLSIFPTNSFDVVFSNSVIEHVGNLEQQTKMAREVERVGKRYFVQTPNYYFPIEPHYLFPGFQWLPVESRAWLLNHFDLGWTKRKHTRAEARESVSSVRLMKKSELVRLFPRAKIYEEKVLSLSKSFVVYDGW